MSDLLTNLMNKAKSLKKRLILAEGYDPRMLKAARRILDEGIASGVVVLGNIEEVKKIAGNEGININGIEIIDPQTSEYEAEFIKAYSKIRPELSEKVILRVVKKDLMFASLMLATGKCDGMVAGISSATASVLQAAGLGIGYAQGVKNPSSFFVMVLPEFRGEKDKVLIFADCAVAVSPDADALARLAVMSANNAAKLTGIKPKVAFLSFSTKGSAVSPETEKVKEAADIAKRIAPELLIDGELQADTALVPEVAKKKLGESPVAGDANVLIFPDLDAGNIAYKLTQYLAKAQAIGPIMQGFKKPVNDLSRGASVDDIVQVAAITAVQAGGN
ncbi:MAG: phosphate acetyltransferase [Candidatus Omnitrophota bacterium]